MGLRDVHGSVRSGARWLVAAGGVTEWLAQYEARISG
jgi:hypothetical protein